MQRSKVLDPDETPPHLVQSTRDGKTPQKITMSLEERLESGGDRIDICGAVVKAFIAIVIYRIFEHACMINSPRPPG